MPNSDVIVLFTLILLCALLGIGYGTHLALVMADGYTPVKPRKRRYVDAPAEPDSKKKPWLPTRDERKEAMALKNRIHSQDMQSFAAFESDVNDEEHAIALEKARAGQDQSYNCLGHRTDSEDTEKHVEDIAAEIHAHIDPDKLENEETGAVHQPQEAVPVTEPSSPPGTQLDGMELPEDELDTPSQEPTPEETLGSDSAQEPKQNPELAAPSQPAPASASSTVHKKKKKKKKKKTQGV